MSMRFPHHGSGRHETPPPATARPQHELSGPRPLRDDAAIPDRACCCPAKPMVKVVMPASPTRPSPVDLWLCGHHWRVSRAALAGVGATVFDVCPPSLHADDQRESTPV